MNATVGEGELIVHNYINIGVAVDLNYEGLIVPVIHDAQDKRLRAIAREMSDLANRARTKKLSADDISGGTVTITNAGGAGTFANLPVINQPQVMILSTEGVFRKPVVVTDASGQRGDRHPLGRQPLDGLGPPCLRRRLRHRLPPSRVRDPRDTRLDRRALGGRVPLRVRWLGSVRYRDALVLQRGLRDRSPDDHLLLLEHPHVYTLGLRTDPAHLLVDPADGGSRARAGRPGRRRDLPRPRPARRLPDPLAPGHRRFRRTGLASGAGPVLQNAGHRSPTCGPSRTC